MKIVFGGIRYVEYYDIVLYWPFQPQKLVILRKKKAFRWSIFKPENVSTMKRRI